MAELKRVLDYKVLLLIVINSIMGTGIFFVPAAGAQIAGPASLISWGILSVFAIYIAMCFGELCSMYPTSGGVYEYCKQAYGRFPSFIIGWLTLIAGNITIAMLIIGAISYLLPATLPNLKVVIMVISAVFILVFNVVAYRGMKTSATMLVTFSFITLGTISALLIPSFFSFSFSNLKPFFVFDNAMIFLAIFFIAETLFGWESPTFFAGETKDGKRVVPKAIVHGTIIICFIALIFVLFSMGSLGWKILADSATPLATLAGMHFGKVGVIVFRLLTYLAIIGSVADWVVSAPRLILSMSNDKLFFPKFGEIHKKFQTPGNAIILQCVISIIFIFLGLGSYETLLHLLVPILLVMYSFVMLSVVILRFTKKDQKRYFRVPFGKVGPIIVVIFFMSLLATWLFLTHDAIGILLKGIILVAFGFPLYLLLEAYYNPDFVVFVENIFAHVTLFTEKLSLPQGVRKQIFHIIGDIKGKVVLEFGCSVGTLTIHLAEEVGPQGKIYATDISKRRVQITQKRMEKKGHNHVIVMHDEQHAFRVHPGVPSIHTVISLGMLGYVQDVGAVLKQINKRLRKGSRICFVDYDKFFDIIPNKDWLRSDERIKHIFRNAGFKVSVMRKQGFAWKYIYIYGVKEREIKK